MKTFIQNSKKESLRDSKIVKLIFILLLFAGALNSTTLVKPIREVNDSLVCLEIQGKIMVFGDGTDNECIVELINTNGEVDTLVLKDNKLKFKFKLEKNSSYAIRISKKGYMSKYVSVNTEIENDNDVIHRFVFETPLLKTEATVHLNKEATDLPIAIIHFDTKKNCFNYNKEYTATIKRELRKGRPVDKKNSLINSNSKDLATAYAN